MGSFTRVQFSSRAAAEVSQGANSVTFRYNDAIAAELGAAQGKLSALGVTVSQTGPETISVSVPPGSKIRSFVGTGTTGFDITPGNGRPVLVAAAPASPPPAPKPAKPQKTAEASSQPPKTEPAKPAPAEQPATVSYQATPDFMTLVIHLNAPGKATLKRTGNTLDILTPERAALKLPGLSATAKEYVRSLSPRTQSGRRGVRVILNGNMQQQFSQSGDTVTLTLTKPGKKEPESKAVEAASATPSEPATPEKPAEAASATPKPSAGIGMVSEGDSLILTLPKVKGAGLVAYSRNGYFWIASNKAIAIPNGALNPPASPLLGEASILPAGGSTIINYVQRRPIQAVIGFDNDQWRIRIAPEAAAERHGIVISTESDKDGTGIATVTVTSSEGFLAPFVMNDPLTAERLLFMPVAGEEAVREPRRMVEMSLPATYQGAVAILAREEITWKAADKQVVFQNTAGRFIGSPAPVAPPPAGSEASAPRPFDEGAADVPALRRAFLKRLLTAKGAAEQADLRATYFQSLVRLGDYPEALGYGAYLMQTHPDYAKAKKADITLGLLNLDAGRPTDAAGLFSADHLKGSPEAQTFLSAAKLLERREPATLDIKALESALRSYPERLQAGILKRLADHYLYHKSTAEADPVLGLLNQPLYSEAVDPVWLKLAQAELIALRGQGQEAIPALKDLAGQIENREIRARASYRLIASQLERRQLTRPDAITALEKLRPVWREEYPEVPLLTTLGDLYLQEKRYRDALDTWRYLVTEYETFPGKPELLKKMSDQFLYLFNEDGAKDMPPLDALTLYYEFRELTPTGPEGDVMIRNLADRLVGVELLDRASALLTHQIRFRVKGEERARVAARLALIHLMNKQPKLAVEVLDYTNTEELPEDLVLMRNRIKAQAYLDLEDFPGALEQLAEDPTAEGQQLRLEILWWMQNWQEVINILTFNLQGRESVDKPLSSLEMENLFRLTLAYVYTGNTPGLKSLRERFLPLLTDETMQQQFDFLTRDDATPDYTNMQAVTARIGQFESFMGTLQKKVQDEGLSKAVE